ncbi:MAG TPA: 5'-nucleotidase C-terminal domain-containing protein [Spirochaetales bacterium]|nr:5'-nucleotidase C-terminal domain-containing protein [Spirochaetales bacterium]
MITATSVSDPGVSASLRVAVIPDDAVVGSTTIDLDGTRPTVRIAETNLGRLIANGMRFSTGADIALMNGGGIRNSLPNGDISRKATYTLLPFGTTIQRVELLGSELDAIVENGVSMLPDASGRYPHFAGLSFTLDASQAAGSRVSNILVNGAPVIDSATYSFAAGNFIISGGDGYTMFAGKAVEDFGADVDSFIDYLSSIGPVTEANIDVAPGGDIAGDCIDTRVAAVSPGIPSYSPGAEPIIRIDPPIRGRSLLIPAADGSFLIENAPLGDYTLSVIFRELETDAVKSVTVTAGGSADAQLRFTAQASFWVYANTSVNLAEAPLSNPAFRTALSDAIDRASFATTMSTADTSRVYVPMTDFLQSTGLGDPIAGLETADYDASAASAYFTGATNYALTIMTDNTAPKAAFIQAVKDLLEAQSGMQVTTEFSSTTALEDFDSGNFQLGRAGWGSDPDGATNDPIPLLNQIFLETVPNVPRFDATTLGGLIAGAKGARAAYDYDTYVTALVAVNNYLIAQLPIIPVLRSAYN